MKKFIPVFASTVFLLALSLVYSCGAGGLDPSDLMTSGNSDVDSRFEDSKDGKGKPIDLQAPTDPQHFSFLWIGDLHERANSEDFLMELGNAASNMNAGFIVGIGDLTDSGEDDDYDYLLFRKSDYLSVPLYSAIGNHDLFSDGYEDFRDKINPSSAAFTYGNSLFMLVDSASCKIGKKQMDWIEDELRGSGATNKFVLTHVCLYDGELETPTILCDPDERLRMLSLLKNYDVDYFLCGHKHYVEEEEFEGTTHLMGGTASPYKRPYNSDPLFWYFQVDGGQVNYTKVDFE